MAYPATPELIGSLLASATGISDIIFSPGRPPQVEQHGVLGVTLPDLPPLTPQDIDRVAADLSYSLPGVARFRVNVFRQRGSLAVVMRVIASVVPTFSDLNLPQSLASCAELKSGLVLVTGPTGSGKSSTLAAIIDLINSTRADHILTIEDPIEFIHPHKKGTVHQRELYSDVPTFAAALKAALRQAPKVILVGEMRDRETIEIALTAAETGHLVFSTLHTIDASKTVERIVGTFEQGDQQAIRARLAACFRAIVSQRLAPKKTGGRVAVIEILRSTMRTRDYMLDGGREGKSLLDAMKDGELDGMQDFDTELERLVREGVISLKTAYACSTNAGNLRVQLADVPDEDSLIVHGFGR